MTGFLTRLIDRHLNPEGNVSPPVRGRFEPARSLSLSRGEQQTYTGNETDIENNIGHPLAEVETSKKSDWPVQSNVPLVNENVNVHVPSSKTVIKPVLEENTKNIRGNKNVTERITEPLKEYTKERGNEIEKTIPPGKESREKVVKSEQIKESTHFSKENPFNKVNETVVVHDPQKQAEREHETIREKYKFFVQPVFLDSEMTFPPNKLKRTDNLQENSKGVLHQPTWSGKQNAGLIRGNVLKETQAQSSPNIKVNIGRIEVRAVMQQAQTPIQTTEIPKPKLSLEDYLKKRNSL